MLAIALCSWVSIFSAGGHPTFILGMPEYDFGSQNYASFMQIYSLASLLYLQGKGFSGKCASILETWCPYDFGF